MTSGILILLLSMYLVAGCRTCPPVEKPLPVVAPPVEIVTVRTDCVTKPPPAKPDFNFTEAGCPDSMAGCVSEESLRALIIYIDDVQKYARDAWIQCGPEPTKEKTP